MIRIVQYITTRIESFRWFKFNISKANTQEVRHVAPFGIDAVPVKDMMAVFAKTKMKGKGIIFGILNTNNSAGEGEVRIYSLDADLVEQIYLHVKADGTIEIGGDGDNAVRHSKNAEVIAEIQDDIADLKTVFSGWTPIPEDGGAALKTAAATWSGTPLEKDIEDAKVDEVKLPS